MVTREEFEKALTQMQETQDYKKEDAITKAFAEYSHNIYSLIDIERDIAVTFYDLKGVKGVNFASDRGVFNEQAHRNKQQVLSNKLELLRARKKEKLELINAFNVFLNALPNKEQKEYIYKVYIHYYKLVYELTMKQLKDI